jgi:5'-deoxynucleotidase YfbR-like HD superfamily hydrolase
MSYFTYSGHVIEANSGSPSLDDIAVQLFRVCRYAGATQMFYPVGLHSMIVADLAPKHLELEALLHDASEAVIGDIPSPVKTDDMRAIEHVIMSRIWKSLGFSEPSETNHKLIKIADRAALMAEAFIVAPPGLIEDYGAIYNNHAVSVLNGYLSRYSYADMLEPRGKAVRDYLERVYRCLEEKKRQNSRVEKVDVFENTYPPIDSATC